MPRILYNIDLDPLPSLRETLNASERSDFCVGYFNLRGWKSIDDLIAKWPGEPGQQCRLLVGMHSLPQEELRNALSITSEQEQLDNPTALRLIESSLKNSAISLPWEYPPIPTKQASDDFCTS